MLVRERNEGFALINQHDHGKISGVFAAHWAPSPVPFEPTLIAVRNHDIGWEALDHTVRWNPETGKPYSFVDFPPGLKLPAYTQGIDQVEAMHPYAGCLCSLHYASFVEMTGELAGSFLRRERARQERLKAQMTPDDRDNLTANLELLKACDRLSLFLCLNEPGENTHPWYREGVRHGERLLIPHWEAKDVIRFDPNPFDRDFEVTILSRQIDQDGNLLAREQTVIRVHGR